MSTARLEAKLRVKVAEVMMLLGYDCSWIESHATSAGVPDLNYENHNRHGWLELKCVGANDDKVRIRPTQYRWFRGRAEKGGSPHMLVEMAGEYFLVRGQDVVLPTVLVSADDLRGRAAFRSNNLFEVLSKLTVV